MKHVFLVNSNITMLTALKTIGYCDIDIRDCVFFCVRKYQIPFAMNIPEEQIRDFDFF